MSTKKGKGVWIAAIAALAVIVVVVVVVAVSANSPVQKYQKQLELAERYLEDLDYDQAIAEYMAAIEIDPKNEDAYVGLTDVYIAMADSVSQDDSDKAVEILENAITELEKLRNDSNAEIVDEQISRIQRYLEKITGESETLSEEETSGDDPYNRLDAGEYDEVLETYLLMLDADATDPEIYLVIVEAYLRKGDYDKALEYARMGYEATGDERLKEKINMIEGGNIVDSEGRILKMSWFEDGVLIWWHEYTYDKSGNSATSTVYDANGNQTDYGEWEYDTDGNCIVSVGGYRHDNGLLIRYLNYYDDKGRKVRSESGENKDFYIRDVNEYLYHGSETSAYRINETTYDRDGNVTQQYYEILESNKDGLTTRRQRFRIKSDGTEVLDLIHDWEYDEDGRRLKYTNTCYNEYGEITSQDVTIYEYDNDGNLQRDITYDRDGNVRYERNYH